MLLFSPNVANNCFFGISLWATRMIPSLFPYLFVCTFLVQSGLSSCMEDLLAPLLQKVFRCSKSGAYCIFIGFLCGFPMGAKSVSDLYKQGKLSKTEAETLSGFCNLFGPGYFTGIILPVLESCSPNPMALALFFIYGMPVLYGVILTRLMLHASDISVKKEELVIASSPSSLPMLLAFQISCKSSVSSMLMLGGYVAICSGFAGILHELVPAVWYGVLLPFFEINQGILFLQAISLPHTIKLFVILFSVSFQGICCMIQAAAFLSEARLSVWKYFVYKMIYSIFVGGIIVIYLLLFY